VSYFPHKPFPQNPALFVAKLAKTKLYFSPILFHTASSLTINSSYVLDRIHSPPCSKSRKILLTSRERHFRFRRVLPFCKDALIQSRESPPISFHFCINCLLQPFSPPQFVFRNSQDANRLNNPQSSDNEHKQTSPMSWNPRYTAPRSNSLSRAGQHNLRNAHFQVEH
jgi:hypothetical protein